MDKTLELELTAACIDILEQGTTALAGGLYELPTSAYTDEETFRREGELLRSVPLVAALSVELKDPGDWKTFSVQGTELLIARQPDGTVGAFLNACRHRGVPVAVGRGSSRRLTCRFHGWTYDTTGALVGVPFAEGFEGMCRAERSLVPVPVEERHGIIWVVADHQAGPMDLDGFLGEFGAELARLDLDTLAYVEHCDHELEANWKMAQDTFCEGYHIQYLHKAAFDLGLVTQVPNRSLFDSFAEGRFQRLTFPFRGIEDFKDRPQEEWNARELWQLAWNYLIFPNTVLAVFGDHVQLFQLMPGDRVDRSVTTQSLYALDEHLSPEDFGTMKESFGLVYDVIANEDFWASRVAQRALATRANDTYVFGRNEPALHNVHDALRRSLGLEPLAPRVPVAVD